MTPEPTPAPTEAPSLVRAIRLWPDPVLLRPSAPVTEFDAALEKLFDELEATAQANEGVGLAAVQIGVLKRAIVVRQSDGTYLRLANPTWNTTTAGPPIPGLEGCLSLPTVFEVVPRPVFVEVSYQDPTGLARTVELHGLTARCLVHECEHLEGRFFTEHFGPMAKIRARALGTKFRRFLGVRSAK